MKKTEHTPEDHDELEDDDLLESEIQEDQPIEEDTSLQSETNADDSDDEGNVLFETPKQSAIKGSDYIISYELQDYINPKTNRPYSAFKLRNKHPKMVFKQHHSGDEDGSHDEEIVMVVNQSLAKQLGDLFNGVYSAYSGINVTKKSKHSFKDIITSIKEYVEFQPLKAAGIVIGALIIIGFVIYGSIIS
jgi:hypothetical protein